MDEPSVANGEWTGESQTRSHRAMKRIPKSKLQLTVPCAWIYHPIYCKLQFSADTLIAGSYLGRINGGAFNLHGHFTRVTVHQPFLYFGLYTGSDMFLLHLYKLPERSARD